MAEYIVSGNIQVTLSMIVEASSEKKAYAKARKQFKGIQSYVGNDGTDKLIGVEGDCTIAADEPVVWDDALRV